ncbi:MAG: hypothetical protein ACRETM_00615, partial [Stenotrophobium sp.]
LTADGNISFGTLTAINTGSGFEVFVDVQSFNGSVNGGPIIVDNEDSFGDLDINAGTSITLAAQPTSGTSIAVSGYDAQDDSGNTASVGLHAGGDITLAGAVLVSAENGTVPSSGTAALDIEGDNTSIGSQSGPGSIHPSVLVTSAGNVAVNIAPNNESQAQLSGDLILSSTGGATGDVNLSGSISAGHVLVNSDNGNIGTETDQNDTLFLAADSVNMFATIGSIDMSLSNITVGTGTFPGTGTTGFGTESGGSGITGGRSGGPNFLGIDPAMISALGSLAPQSATPNAAFFAGGTVDLGDLTMIGDYLYLSSSGSPTVGPLSHNGSTPLFVNFVPSNPASTISLTGVDTLATTFNGPLTLAYGSSQYTGPITADPGGQPLDVLPTSTNFVFDTPGAVSGFDALQTNGQVAQIKNGVLTFRGQTTPTPPPPPADDEIVAAGKTATQSVLQSTFGNTPGSHHTLTGGTDEYGNPLGDYSSIEQQTDSDITDKSCK